MSEHPFRDVPPPIGPGTLLHWRADFGNEPGSIAAARDLTRDFLAELPGRAHAALSAGTAGDVLLIVSELVTNAERHDGGPRLLDLTCTRNALEVTVWDTSAVMPVRMPKDPARNYGHGIEIVSSLCSRLLAERVTGGKRVRARISLP